jgi:hypothetical protein
MHAQVSARCSKMPLNYDPHITYQQSVHTDVLLPTVDHSNFEHDTAAQHALLELLYDKLSVEHAGSPPRSRNLFLNLDAEVRDGLLLVHGSHFVLGLDIFT